MTSELDPGERPGALADLTPYERLIRLALTALGLLTLVSLACALPWRGLLVATAQPDQLGIPVGSLYLALRVALRFFPWVTGVGLAIGWGLFALRRPRPAFYAAAAALVLLLLAAVVVIGFALSINLLG